MKTSENDKMKMGTTAASSSNATRTTETSSAKTSARAKNSATSKSSTSTTKAKTHEDRPESTAGKKSKYTGETESDFHTLFVDELKDIYWAEKHLKMGLAKMCSAATSKELTAAFNQHRDDGNGQIATLETIFELLGEKPEAKRCEAMAGLLKEAESIIADTKRNTYVRDAGLILAAQKAEHYEIATYGTLLALAEFLPEKEVRRHLATILKEEKKTDMALTKLAESFINEYASAE